ncbi:Glycosyltransferase, family I [Desulfonema limicola]|uniref:Glycosyltransferase, family I n=1 Tax=Desulfonema limicola TaxID=45656 RepID=A0A975BDH5_9BACT|nr:glycosyltransferase [Desulfonema limicola]QTA83255.1 Glycosyltransferase, family I [Desulfonema limicola]
MNKENSIKRKTVLFISHSSDLYGAERSFLDLIMGLKKNNAIVLCPSKGLFTEILERHNIKYIKIFYKKWTHRKYLVVQSFFQFFINIIACIRVFFKIRKNKIDMVYTNTSVCPIGSIISIFFRCPHIWHIRESPETRIYDLGKRATLKCINAASNVIVCNSQFIKNSIRPYVDNVKLNVVYNGILDEKDFSTKKGRKYFIHNPIELCIVGSVLPHKGHEDAIRAVAALYIKGYDAILKIVGEGNYNYIQKLKNLCNNLGISSKILFNGYHNNPFPFYVNSDITIICSRYEAFGRVAVEAMSVGCPVIATNNGGLTEIIEDGETGLLYEIGSNDMLANQIIKLVDTPDLYEKISENAIEDVFDRFTKQQYINDIEYLICNQ